MRDIKFRALRKDGGGWVYLTVNNRLMTQIDKGYLPSNEIEPNTVGQYTGLKDKNGKEIYEGDRVKVWQEYYPYDMYTATVKFGNPNCGYAWGWNLVFDEPFDMNPDILLWVEMEEGNAYCEITGNIHDCAKD